MWPSKHTWWRLSKRCWRLRNGLMVTDRSPLSFPRTRQLPRSHTLLLLHVKTSRQNCPWRHSSYWIADCWKKNRIITNTLKNWVTVNTRISVKIGHIPFSALCANLDAYRSAPGVLFWNFFLCCVGRGHWVGCLGQTVVHSSATVRALLEGKVLPILLRPW